MKFKEYYEARSILEDLLRKDLLGPVKENEVIRDTRPEDYYITGRLYPQGKQINQEDLEKSQLDDDTEDAEQPVNLCYSYYPSSMALSFTIRPGVDRLIVETGFAWYVPQEKDGSSRRKRPEYEWHRQAKSVTVEIDTSRRYQLAVLHEGLELRVYLQKEFHDGAKTFTVALVNTHQSTGEMVVDNRNMFFQPEIKVSGENGEAVFIEKKMRVSLNQDPEVLTLEMLYRHNRTFAVGHGCSAGWKAEGEYATEVFTEFLIGYELLQMKPAMHVRQEFLSFQFLSQETASVICKALTEMADSYGQWINEVEKQIPNLTEGYREVALENISRCRETLLRIRNGINLLASNRMVFQAFQFVNQAMLRLRIQYTGSRDLAAHCWYPFQLAFILQELCSVVNPEDPYRDVVDLLWFPTGGGKTEAYLGLSALTIFLRRMRGVQEGRSGGGVTIIMRYTLRLLTLQQFERASALICACELIRREKQDLLGTEEIATGLWVGGGLTPNIREKAVKSLEIIYSQGFDALGEEEANPCQVQACPWCKSPIRPAHYGMAADKMVIACPNEQCPFHNGLPVYVIDEDIYDHRPALVVATIDKFARMTWEKKVGSLFALRTELLPPELIIQDELHLISGPLGTIAGLYEIAVDEFCRRNRLRPKIIASTATIRNAGSQILNLYGREFRQFPPQGIDIRDSYFAEESSPAEKPSRRYVGILAPGTSGNTLLIRVYSVMLFATRYLSVLGYPDNVVDSFWTLTGYFNSLKQLGGAMINVIDDVHGRLKYLYGTKFKDLLPSRVNPKEYLEFDELTSRKRNVEIGKTLKKLEVRYPNPETYDLVLASNMLSVGIDVSRLGLMVLQGQPKSNSEYIQATSRVGRQTPGLVLTMYDASRSRDRSHYEQFLSYHSSLYRYVEATSLTPFAERSRDRALHAVLISLCRHLIDGLLDNGDAARVSDFRPEVEGQINTILARVQVIDALEYEDTREHLLEILNEWENMAIDNDLVYQKYFNLPGTPLLTDRFDDSGGAFPTLNSMRNVDVECEVYLEV